MFWSADIEPSRRAAQIARIEALRGEKSVSRYDQRLIEPAAWVWLFLTFVASSVAQGLVGLVGEHLPRQLTVVLTGVALFVAVAVVDSLFVVTPSRQRSAAPAGPAGARRAMVRTTSWAIRTALLLLVLGGAALVAVFRFASAVPAVDRAVEFLDRQRDAIERSMRADSVDCAVRGRTTGDNWQLLARHGHYLAAPFADAQRLCAALGTEWTIPLQKDFAPLTPPPDDPTTLQVWMSRGNDRNELTATSAQIAAGSWQPAGYLSSKETPSATDSRFSACGRGADSRMGTIEEMERFEDLSDADLDRLEDRLLTERELDWTMRSRATAGRIVVFLLIAALFLILQHMAGRLLGGVELGVLLFIILYVLLLGGAVVGAWTIWKSVGMRGRQLLRRALHYWPVTLYLIALLAGGALP